MRQYKLDIACKDIKKFYKQFTVNYLLNPEKWTRPKVNTERSQMNNSTRIAKKQLLNSEKCYNVEKTTS